jgi:hypothetical protein
MKLLECTGRETITNTSGQLWNKFNLYTSGQLWNKFNLYSWIGYPKIPISSCQFSNLCGQLCCRMIWISCVSLLNVSPLSSLVGLLPSFNFPSFYPFYVDRGGCSPRAYVRYPCSRCWASAGHGTHDDHRVLARNAPARERRGGPDGCSARLIES